MVLRKVNAMTEFRQDLGLSVLSMDRKSSPCKDCPDRKIGCHGRCEAYQSWRLGVDGVIQERINRIAKYAWSERRVKATNEWFRNRADWWKK